MNREFVWFMMFLTVLWSTLVFGVFGLLISLGICLSVLGFLDHRVKKETEAVVYGTPHLWKLLEMQAEKHEREHGKVFLINPANPEEGREGRIAAGFDEDAYWKEYHDKREKK